MIKNIIIILALLSFFSCDWTTDTKVIIVNSSPVQFTVTAYKNNEPVGRLIYKEMAGENETSVILDKYSIILFEEVYRFGPPKPYDPWTRYDRIKLIPAGNSPKIVLTKSDAMFYKKDDQTHIYLFELQ